MGTPVLCFFVRELKPACYSELKHIRMDPAALMAMMGQQRKPEPWTWKAAGKALAGVTIVAAVGTYVWDSRGAPLGSIGEIKRAMAMCGYHVSGLPFRVPIVNDF